ncbi:MAG: hypothetical protein WC121_06850 [Candidatus Kapaibacterium sp.]
MSNLKKEDNYLDLLKNDFYFLVSEHNYLLKFELLSRGEYYLKYFNKHCKRQVNITLQTVNSFVTFEIEIVKTRYFYLTREGELFCSPKYFIIKEYCSEISSDRITKDKFGFRKPNVSNIDFVNRREYIERMLVQDINLYKTLIKFYLTDIIVGKKWVNWGRIRKRNLQESK